MSQLFTMNRQQKLKVAHCLQSSNEICNFCLLVTVCMLAWRQIQSHLAEVPFVLLQRLEFQGCLFEQTLLK